MMRGSRQPSPLPTGASLGTHIAVRVESGLQFLNPAAAFGGIFESKSTRSRNFGIKAASDMGQGTPVSRTSGTGLRSQTAKKSLFAMDIRLRKMCAQASPAGER